MDNINIIKDALEKCQEILPYAITDDEGKWNGEVRSVIKELEGALAALDRVTIKVDDEEIDKIVLEDLTDDSHVGLGLTHEGALAIARTFLGRGLRIARSNWLKTSPWIKTSEQLPSMETEIYGAMVSDTLLGEFDTDDKYDVIRCQQVIEDGHIEWFNGVDVIDPPIRWMLLPEPPNPTK